MMFGVRVVALVALISGCCGVFGASGCSQTFSCTGELTGVCSGLDSSTCGKTVGCHGVKGSCLSQCVAPGASCPDDSCRSTDGTCASLCDGILDESSCGSLTSPLGVSGLGLHECVWDANDGCKSPCAAITGAKACDEQAAAGCVWVACGGKPLDSCSSYSGDDCPTSLGCDRTSRPVGSDE
jgi:hypothetical protein